MIAFAPIDANSQLIEAELGDVTYQVGLDWNEEAGRWTLSLRNLDDAVLISGVPVMQGALLLRQARNPSCPPGDFLATHTVTGARIGRQDFAAGRAALHYMDPDDIAAYRDAAAGTASAAAA